MISIAQNIVLFMIFFSLITFSFTSRLLVFITAALSLTVLNVTILKATVLDYRFMV